MSKRKIKAADLSEADLSDVRDWFNGTFYAVPSDMAAALAVAAANAGMTVAEYLRRAAYLCMSADGIRVDDFTTDA
jgi:hypothetical protein